MSRIQFARQNGSTTKPGEYHFEGSLDRFPEHRAGQRLHQVPSQIECNPLGYRKREAQLTAIRIHMPFLAAVIFGRPRKREPCTLKQLQDTMDRRLAAPHLVSHFVNFRSLVKRRPFPPRNRLTHQGRYFAYALSLSKQMPTSQRSSIPEIGQPTNQCQSHLFIAHSAGPKWQVSTRFKGTTAQMRLSAPLTADCRLACSYWDVQNLGDGDADDLKAAYEAAKRDDVAPVDGWRSWADNGPIRQISLRRVKYLHLEPPLVPVLPFDNELNRHVPRGHMSNTFAVSHVGITVVPQFPMAIN